jgi:hypothetical protein
MDFQHRRLHCVEAAQSSAMPLRETFRLKKKETYQKACLGEKLTA